MFNIQRRFTSALSKDIPFQILTKSQNAEEQIQTILRFQWRKLYELMVPILLLGGGKSFGELAVQKELNVKIAHLAKARQASVLCRTNCKFAVMSKSNY